MPLRLLSLACLLSVFACAKAPEKTLSAPTAKEAPDETASSKPEEAGEDGSELPGPGDEAELLAILEQSKPPTLTHRVEPEFPQLARDLGIRSATCQVGLTVDTEGVPQALEVTGCEGVFQKSVQRAVALWRWEPASEQGRPIDTKVRFPVRFVLQ